MAVAVAVAVAVTVIIIIITIWLLCARLKWLAGCLCTCFYLHVNAAIIFSQTVVPLKKKKPGKNPDVDTSFLPDREREVHFYYLDIH